LECFGTALPAELKTQRQRFQSPTSVCWLSTPFAKLNSLTDALTTLANRKHFDKTLSSAVAQHNVDGQKFSLFLCDIDHFKQFNDTFGHLTGDRVAHRLIVFDRLRDGNQGSLRRDARRVAPARGSEFLARGIITARPIRQSRLRDLWRLGERSESPVPSGRASNNHGLAQT
jgi:GGDEF domain-containing protein